MGRVDSRPFFLEVVLNKLMVAVSDRAVGAFMNPFVAPSIGWAVRSFSDEVNRKGADNQLAAHPEDYELWVLAVYDDETGAFSAPPDGARAIARGKEVVVKES